MILHKLFEPITIKGLHVKNRIIMPPMHNNLGSMEEGITDKAIDFFSARARGGFGMIGIGVIDTYYVPGASSRDAFYLDNEKHQKKHAQAVKQNKKLKEAEQNLTVLLPNSFHSYPKLKTFNLGRAKVFYMIYAYLTISRE